MPIGTSDGQFYADEMEYTLADAVKRPDQEIRDSVNPPLEPPTLEELGLQMNEDPSIAEGEVDKNARQKQIDDMNSTHIQTIKPEEFMNSDQDQLNI